MRFLYLFPLRLYSVSRPLLVSVTKSSQKPLKEGVVYFNIEFDSTACQRGAMATGEAASWSHAMLPTPIPSQEKEKGKSWWSLSFSCSLPYSVQNPEYGMVWSNLITLV